MAPKTYQRDRGRRAINALMGATIRLGLSTGMDDPDAAMEAAAAERPVLRLALADA